MYGAIQMFGDILMVHFLPPWMIRQSSGQYPSLYRKIRTSIYTDSVETYELGVTGVYR